MTEDQKKLVEKALRRNSAITFDRPCASLQEIDRTTLIEICSTLAIEHPELYSITGEGIVCCRGNLQ